MEALVSSASRQQPDGREDRLETRDQYWRKKQEKSKKSAINPKFWKKSKQPEGQEKQAEIQTFQTEIQKICAF